MQQMIDRLSQLRYLKKEIDELSQRIAQLELDAQGGVGRISGLPGRRSNSDRAANYALEIVTLKERMEDRRMDCMEELGRLYAFIDDVPDSRMRLILSARYIDGLSWQQVAWRIDETDEQVPRRLHNRLLKQVLAENQKNAENTKFDENDERIVL